MTANKRTFEVDRFLTRELLLRNPDNSYPSANQVVFTDGNGGTYLAPVNPDIPTTGFNQITLADSGAIFSANLPFNNLNIKQGLGVIISKQNINSQDYLTFQVSALVPSSFNAVNTQDGTVYADGFSSMLNVVGYDSVKVKASTNNTLYIGGTPAFGIINLSTSQGQQYLYPSTSLSSVTIQAGFGITLAKTGPTSYSIANTISTFALNRINVQGQSTLNFLDQFNAISLSTNGNTQLSVNSTTITIGNFAFSNIQLPNGSRMEASTLNNSLQITPGYGLTYSTVNSTLQINTSLPSSFSIISTTRGTLVAGFSTNILTLNNGYGIDYLVNAQALTIKLASTFVSQISTETGIITATNQSIANFRQGKSIVYSTSSDNMLYINSKDYNRIDIVDGTTGLITTSLFATLNQKTFTFVQGPGISIVGNTNNNQILIQPTSTIFVSGPQYAFSFVQVYSTASFLGEGLTLFQNTQTINAAPNGQAVLGIVPVFPLQSQTDVANNNLYLAIDQSTMLFSTNTQLSSLNATVSTFQINSSTISLSASTITTANALANNINISSLKVNGSLVITSASTLSSLIIASEVSTVYLEAQLSCPSTIGYNQISSPLMVFNYISSQVGINLGTGQPQTTLHVGGTILAENFATYSDSSLKNFKDEYQVTTNDLQALKPWIFNWKDSDIQDVGFAAEDVEAIMPSAVKIGPTGLRMVDYGRLSVVSLAALRNTNNRLDAVESTLQSLVKQRQL